MSASTQATTTQTNGNGHVRAKPGRKPGVKAAVKTPAPPLSQGVTGAAALTAAQPSVLAERRIGPVPAITAPVGMFPPGSGLNWLYTRQQECQIELRLINQMIAQFGPRRTATAIGTAPRKAKSKKAKRAKAAIKQAA